MKLLNNDKRSMEAKMENELPIIYRAKQENDLILEMADINVCPEGIKAMRQKGISYVVRLRGLSFKAANVLKQEMLALDAEAAVSRWVIGAACERSDVLLMATKKQLLRLIQRLPYQPFGLSNLASIIEQALQNFDKHDFTIKCTHGNLQLAERTHIMGILNITPDSFSDGGKFYNHNEAVIQAEKMIAEGADIIDIGGESTRPGAEPVGIEEEMRRVIPVIERIREKHGCIISIDTQNAKTAEAAIEAGADIVNDVSALRKDPLMATIVAKHGVPVVLMHILGTPKDMQENIHYEMLLEDIFDFLHDRAHHAISAGIDPSNIIIDPGIGFGKTVEHNLQIIRNLDWFKSLGYPILLGVSRKSFIGRLTGAEVNDRLYGTIAASVLGIANGANIMRVHDVAAARQAVTITDAVLQSGIPRKTYSSDEFFPRGKEKY